MLDAEQSQEVALLVGARRGIDFGPAPLRDLDRRNAHAAGGPVDQHLLARLQVRQVMQGVVRGKEGAGSGRRRLE